MDTVAPVDADYGTVEYYAARLRRIAAGLDSHDAWLITEGTALGLIGNAANDRHTSDARRLAEVRNILAALAVLKAERAARLAR